MAWDPVLAAHAIGPYCFEVGGDLSPSSIRDQMVRSRLLVDRLFRENLVETGKNLLVVGAGAAGVTAAIRAASLGVRTVLVEKATVAFSRQRLCVTRDVDPTLYDWPVDHWPLGRFPWAGPRMPLAWTAARANAVALGWELRLRRAMALYHGTLDVRFSTAPAVPTPPAAPPVVGGLLQVRLISRTAPPAVLRFGALVSCVGFGAETCSIGAYPGHAFWDSDLLETYNLGIQSAPSVAVSGGGDGAIQDFIRAVTRNGARHAYAKLRNAGSPVVEALDRAERMIQSAEDQAQRALVWNVAAVDDDAVLDRLEWAHADAVADLTASAAWPDIDRLLAGLVRTPTPHVVIARKGARFSRCYALNRFLALLFLRMAQDRAMPITRVTNVTLASVTGIGHTCVGPASCHGQDHDVRFAPVPGVPPGTAGLRRRCNVVVVRHGILGPLNLILPRPTVNKRHMLPYHLTA